LPKQLNFAISLTKLFDGSGHYDSQKPQQRYFSSSHIIPSQQFLAIIQHCFQNFADKCSHYTLFFLLLYSQPLWSLYLHAKILKSILLQISFSNGPKLSKAFYYLLKFQASLRSRGNKILGKTVFSVLSNHSSISEFSLMFDLHGLALLVSRLCNLIAAPKYRFLFLSLAVSTFYLFFKNLRLLQVVSLKYLHC